MHVIKIPSCSQAPKRLNEAVCCKEASWEVSLSSPCVMPKCHATNILSEKLALRNIAPEYPKEIFNKHFPTCFFLDQQHCTLKDSQHNWLADPSVQLHDLWITQILHFLRWRVESAHWKVMRQVAKEKMPASDTSQTTSIEGTAALMDRQQDSCHPKIF